jgi:hypothetical protein
MNKTDVKANAYATTTQLANCGWHWKCRQGDYEVWEQANEELYYVKASGLIIGVFQKEASKVSL